MASRAQKRSELERELASVQSHLAWLKKELFTKYPQHDAIKVAEYQTAIRLADAEVKKLEKRLTPKREFAKIDRQLEMWRK